MIITNKSLVTQKQNIYVKVLLENNDIISHIYEPLTFNQIIHCDLFMATETEKNNIH
jgi:hypothetical protein